MIYINLKCPYKKEIATIDSFDNYKEARKMLKEYKISSKYFSEAYLSQRATKYFYSK